MIPINKEEKELIVSLYPNARFTRTMKHDSKRHHYYCVENEKYLRLIMDGNAMAKEIVETIERKRALKQKRRGQGDKHDAG